MAEEEVTRYKGSALLIKRNPLQLATEGGSEGEKGPTPYHLVVMTHALSRAVASSGNPAGSILTTGNYAPPTESPDSERLLGPVWTSSGLTIRGGCRMYCGDQWRSGTIAATGLTDQGEGFALVRTAKGMARCTDRRNLQTTEEARLFKNHQTRWRNQRRAALRRLEEGQNHG